MKKVIKYLNVFTIFFRVRQDVSNENQTIVSFIKDELQTFIETNITSKKKKEKPFCLNRDGLKKLLTMNPMENLEQKRAQHQRISHCSLITTKSVSA